MTALTHSCRPHTQRHSRGQHPDQHDDRHGAAHHAAVAAHSATAAAAAAAQALADLHDVTDRPCPGRHPADATPLGTPTWCQSCTERVQRALAGPMGIADLLALATDREDGRLLEGAAAPGPRVKSSPVPASPSAAIDEIDDIHRWATDWATYLAVYLGHTPDEDTPDVAARMPDLHTALAYLTRWVRPALAGPIAAEFGAAVLWVHRRLQRAAGEHDQRRRLRVPCPACHALGLIREDGGIGTRRRPEDTEQIEVECTFCGAAWTDPAFQAALEQAS